jgi:hypothetical protein
MASHLVKHRFDMFPRNETWLAMDLCFSMGKPPIDGNRWDKFYCQVLAICICNTCFICWPKFWKWVALETGNMTRLVSIEHIEAGGWFYVHFLTPCNGR